MRKIGWALLASAALSASPAFAGATLLTDYQFSGSNFYRSNGTAPPFDPLSGTFSLLYDYDSNSVSLHSLSLDIGGSHYDTTNAGFDAGSGYLGGNENGLGNPTGLTNDFWFTGGYTPDYSNGATGSFYYTTGDSGRVNRASSTELTPLSSTYSSGPGAPAPLLGLGILPALAAFGGLFATRLRRRPVAMA